MFKLHPKIKTLIRSLVRSVGQDSRCPIEIIYGSEEPPRKIGHKAYTGVPWISDPKLSKGTAQEYVRQRMYHKTHYVRSTLKIVVGGVWLSRYIADSEDLFLLHYLGLGCDFVPGTALGILMDYLEERVPQIDNDTLRLAVVTKAPHGYWTPLKRPYRRSNKKEGVAND